MSTMATWGPVYVTGLLLVAGGCPAAVVQKCCTVDCTAIALVVMISKEEKKVDFYVF